MFFIVVIYIGCSIFLDDINKVNLGRNIYSKIILGIC